VLKEKYLVFFVLAAVMLNVMVLSCLTLMGIRLDARQHLKDLALGKS